MVQMLCNSAELALLDLFEIIGHGEIYNVHASCEPGDTQKQVEEKVARFFSILRENDSLARVVIHNGEPAYAEINKLIDGHSCLLKIKF